MNRGNPRQEQFHRPDDFVGFARLLDDASGRLAMRLVAWCLTPNYFHLVVWQHLDGDLSHWLKWLLTSHVRRYHRQYESSGRVWEGRVSDPARRAPAERAPLHRAQPDPSRPGQARGGLRLVVAQRRAWG
jgi:hypothetical protein